MAIIFATSGTVIHRNAFVAGVQKSAPTKAVRQGFSNWWDHEWFWIVKGWHFTEYAILCALLYRALKRPWLALIIAALFAASDEFHQTFIPDRGGNVRDVLIDSSGAVAGLLLTAFAEKWLQSRRTVKELSERVI